MEKIHEVLAGEAIAHIELRKFKAARQKMEADPPPKPTDLSGWTSEMQATLKAQMETVSRSIVHKAKVEIESNFTIEGLKAGVLKIFHFNLSNEIESVLFAQYLPVLQKSMEEILFSREMERFERRFENVDGQIKRWEGRTPKPFSPELINMEARFPISRCRELQGRYFDVWLSEAIKSKPVFFDSPDYVDKLIQFYNEVYLPLAKKEQEAKEPKAGPPPLPEEEVTLKGEDPTYFSNRHPRIGGDA